MNCICYKKSLAERIGENSKVKRMLSFTAAKFDWLSYIGMNATASGREK